jgi:hypothetical protein
MQPLIQKVSKLLNAPNRWSIPGAFLATYPTLWVALWSFLEPTKIDIIEVMGSSSSLIVYGLIIYSLTATLILLLIWVCQGSLPEQKSKKEQLLVINNEFRNVAEVIYKLRLSTSSATELMQEISKAISMVTFGQPFLLLAEHSKPPCSDREYHCDLCNSSAEVTKQGECLDCGFCQLVWTGHRNENVINNPVKKNRMNRTNTP